MNGVIYMYTSPSGKSYIGQTINLNKRISRHKSAIDKTAFSNAVKKYGYENLVFKIIHTGIDNIDILNDLEKNEIIKNNTMYPNGYNLTSGGENFIQNSISNKKRSISMSGKKLTEEHKMKLKLNHVGMTGRKLSEKHKEAFIGSHRGKKLSDEHRRKLSISHIGKKATDETKKKMSESRIGKRFSEEVKLGLLNRNGKKIICIETGIEYESACDAQRKIGKPNGTAIIQCINNYTETAYGLHWIRK